MSPIDSTAGTNGTNNRGQTRRTRQYGIGQPIRRGDGLAYLAREGSVDTGTSHALKIAMAGELPVLETGSDFQPRNHICPITFDYPDLENTVYIVDSTHRTRDDKPTVHMFDKEKLQKWFQNNNINPKTSHIVTPDMLRRPPTPIIIIDSDADN